MWELKKTALYLLDFLFPPCCIGCKQHGSLLCPACLACIQLLQAPLCRRCCTPLRDTTYACQRCYQHPLQFSGLRVVGTYQEPLRSYIHAFKYDGHKRLADPLGNLLTQMYNAYAMHVDVIIPVPLHPEKELLRGYNQAQLLAEVCARNLHLPVYTSILQRTRPTQAQVHLSLQERQDNVRGAFQCRQDAATKTVADRKILVIDDVCTTGSTLAACAQPLLQAGAREVWALVLARPL
jgi:ComF family protein